MLGRVRFLKLSVRQVSNVGITILEKTPQKTENQLRKPTKETILQFVEDIFFCRTCQRPEQVVSAVKRFETRRKENESVLYSQKEPNTILSKQLKLLKKLYSPH